ncbi:hypothetical protein GDO78_000144 [Eleutherodactylus coqui]|uniref:Uncharacterized protein n=1 Tax=Eleutherodactylus coqui TaxID=57060 RepID=A0A8J6KFW6_ELECQ|nr:hypothetical protein GDO78_000144 [Eleutherodactylus coqui]
MGLEAQKPFSICVECVLLKSCLKKKSVSCSKRFSAPHYLHPFPPLPLLLCLHMLSGDMSRVFGLTCGNKVKTKLCCTHVILCNGSFPNGSPVGVISYSLYM